MAHFEIKDRRGRLRLAGASLLMAMFSHGASAQASGAAAEASAAQRAKAETSQGGNRIEVTNNSVSGVRCANGGSVSVNSVDVNAASLKGRTVIVQGHNTGDVKEVECPEDNGSGKKSKPSQINSITIR
ncbi:hypothetical protein G7048_06575 [Diaphorobacter sp. HDW4B]|uniref:hypothetical protein n=1 Tax=Diaphorobacter sp. HDW4B TaxID=2714925 RepID=UPI00140AF280|nr:hypothetical protein [Diaphorobacter sp. HDW4B]QIL70048.1 hypothetical protein G7048_06575 [Diaphorobacter sp. HDW4B]